MDRADLPRLACALLLAGAALPARAQMPPAATGRFFTKRTVVWQGATQVIPVNVAAAGAADQTFPATAVDPSVVEVLRAPTVLAGETTGYLRVRGLRTGRTQLRLEPGESINLEVKPDPAAAALADIDPDHRRARIVSPMESASVFGQFGVGVEVFDSPINLQDASLPPAPTTSHRVQLRLPDGRLLDAVTQTAPESSPLQHYYFSVAAADMAPGPFKLVAVVTPADAAEGPLNATPNTPQESDPLNLVAIARPEPDATQAGECESVMGVTKEELAPAHPFRNATGVPATVNDPAASGARTLAMPGGNSVWCLPVTVKTAGDYELFIEARGDMAFGVYPSVALYLDYSERPIGTVRLAGPRYHRLPVGGRIALEAGPQVLSLAFRNDFNYGKEDRNLYLDRYELVRVGDTPPKPPEAKKNLHGAAHGPALAAQPTHLTPPPVPDVGGPVAPASTPRLNILYPAGGASVFGADAVVAQCTAVAPLSWLDVVVDGQPQGLRVGNPRLGDAILFPLLLRNLPPGEHRLTIRCADAQAIETDSPVQILNVLAQPPATPGRYDRAVRLLDRLAFGPEPAELAALLTLGEGPWLNNRLAGSFDSPAEQAAQRIARTRFPNANDEFQTAARALQQWMTSDNPVRSRFTAWAENHFTTWMSKTRAEPKWNEHYEFSRLGIAPFGDLLSASAHSTAMVTYLDQEKSYASKLNENYAREIMELHTLGVHGGYQQSDVTALASILNGWTLVNEAPLPERATAQLVLNQYGNEAGLASEFLFAPALNDGKPRRVFGLQFPAAEPTARYDRVRLAIELLASHPRTAEHVCRQLAEHYVAAPAPDRLVAALGQTFMENGGDMRAVLRAMVSRPEFWQAEPKLATPLDFGLRLGRLCRAAATGLGVDPNEAARADAIEGFLKKSGMGLFDHVSPNGYPENSASYADSNALLQRWRFTQTMVEPLGRLAPPGWRKPPEPAAGSPGTPEDPGQRFIDLAALRLTGRLLSPDSNRVAMDVLGDPTPDHMRQTMVFVSLLPEVNLR